MNWLKYIIFFALFFFLALFQASFLPYFAIASASANLVFVLFFLVIFFERDRGFENGFFAAVVAGFFSDMFLPSYFGLSIATFLIIYFANKFSSRLFREGESPYLVFYFTGAFCLSLLAYQTALYGASSLLGFEFHFGVTPLIASLLYSLAFALPGFYLFKALFSKDTDNQLKLL